MLLHRHLNRSARGATPALSSQATGKAPTDQRVLPSYPTRRYIVGIAVKALAVPEGMIDQIPVPSVLPVTTIKVSRGCYLTGLHAGFPWLLVTTYAVLPIRMRETWRLGREKGYEEP